MYIALTLADCFSDRPEYVARTGSDHGMSEQHDVQPAGQVAAVLGGIGSIRGALLGGLVLGVAESLAAGLISSTHKDVTTFILLAGVLLFRPTGILGLPMRVRETLTSRPAARPSAIANFISARIDELKDALSVGKLPAGALAFIGAALILATPLIVVSGSTARRMPKRSR